MCSKIYAEGLIQSKSSRMHRLGELLLSVIASPARTAGLPSLNSTVREDDTISA